MVPAGTGRFAAFEDDDEDDDDDDHGDDNSHEPGVQEEEEGKLSDEDFEEDLRQAMAASLELHTALAAGTNTPVLSGGEVSCRNLLTRQLFAPYQHMKSHRFKMFHHDCPRLNP